MPFVFTYGPDAVQGRMFDRVGPTEFLGSAELAGFELSFDKPSLKSPKEGLPNLRESAGGAAVGAVFELNLKQLELLDGFYGGYERRAVEVRLLDPEAEGGTRPAQAWIARRTKAGLSPARSTLELTRRALTENGAAPETLTALDRFQVLDD
jgi:hypothetical protein